MFLATLGVKDRAVDWQDDWLGTPMFWSYNAPEVATQQIVDAGFHIDQSQVEAVRDGIEGSEKFLWVIARKAG